MQQVWKTTGVKPKELSEQPDLPEELRYLWEWYLELRSSQLLTFSEIHFWSELTQKRLRGWEVELLRILDRIYWNVLYDKSNQFAD